MDVVECIESRTSIRSFKPDPIDDLTLNEALRVANLAPSAGNLQARDFVVVKSIHTRKALSEAAYNQDFVKSAPAVIVVCANLDRIGHYGDRGRTLYCIQDAAAAVQNMMLFLHSKGIGSVWVGAFDEEKAAEALGLPEHARPVAIVPIGYPAETGVRRRRLLQSQIVHMEKW
ncbi:MAG: nitroreductase family protein [Thermoplasmatota archaeon]|nr:nitroreductase family protein [Candidatus Thermoplasmatota archaeon]MBU1913673.1 nitroreductase family protein [Candidatus Thermoplasmatota archaeon]